MQTRNNRHGQTGVTCCETARSHSLPYFTSGRFHRQIFLRDENEPSMKVFQEVMIHSGVEVAVRETKRQHCILRISAERNASVRVTDDVSLLNWSHHFAMQFFNKMRTGRRWRKPMVQFGEKFWIHEIGEKGINSFVKR